MLSHSHLIPLINIWFGSMDWDVSEPTIAGRASAARQASGSLQKSDKKDMGKNI